MKFEQQLAGIGMNYNYFSQLSARMTVLGVISWLSVCLIVVGLFPQASTTLGGLWLMAGLFGLTAAVGLSEVAKSEIREQNQLLSSYLCEARTDALTGLGNRRAFDSHCQNWQASWREGRTLALVFIDVDRFKSFNDRFGHQAGDEMLRAVARVLKQQTEHAGTAMRYGGEEFAVVLPDANLFQAVTWAETVRKTIAARTVAFRTVPLNVTVSIGVAVTRTEDNTESLIVRADEQLYQSKAAGRNCTRPHAQETIDVDSFLATIQPASAAVEPC